jgi:hypothetical protein
MRRAALAKASATSLGRVNGLTGSNPEMPVKSLALIGNASGQCAEGWESCSEAFSIRRLEGSGWQWWALLWSCRRAGVSGDTGNSLLAVAGGQFDANRKRAVGAISGSLYQLNWAIKR